MTLNHIKMAFDDENARRAAYTAQMKANWDANEGHDLALVTARHIKVAMSAGAKKVDILRAINRKGYKVVDDYIDLLNNQPAHDNTDDAAHVTIVDETEVSIVLKNYNINGDVFTGVVEFRKDDDGDWLYADDTEMAVAVDNELFYNVNGQQTVLQRKWDEVVG